MTVHTPTGGCSREYSTMGERLMERRSGEDEDLGHGHAYCELESLLIGSRIRGC